MGYGGLKEWDRVMKGKGRRKEDEYIFVLWVKRMNEKYGRAIVARRLVNK